MKLRNDSGGWPLIPGGSVSGKSRFAPNYVEHWRTAVETGALVGPSKISFIWSYIPGFDRRHGVRIDRQPYPPLNIATGLTNVSLFRPYSLLLSYTYGSGNNSITPDSRHGYMTDANIFGMRLDYAIAANLNIFGTAFTANRISHGYGQGYIRPEYFTSLDPNLTQVALPEGSSSLKLTTIIILPHPSLTVGLATSSTGDLAGSSWTSTHLTVLSLYGNREAGSTTLVLIVPSQTGRTLMFLTISG